MKNILIALLAALPLFASAEALQITAKVLDRAGDGSAIRELYVYPSVVLEPGEAASLHIGKELRVPVWTQKVDLGDGVSKQETVYEEIPVGLICTLKYEIAEGIITYRGTAVAKMTFGTSGTATLNRTSEIIFYGKVELGGLVEIELAGPDGTVEDIALHFGPAPDET
jgi:hypothetical protein